MRDKKVTFIVQAAVIAALYVVLTFVANALGLASHTIQVRFPKHCVSCLFLRRQRFRDCGLAVCLRIC